ncbi:MauE/DoxX family redox-associated membrane protein [Sphingobacterium multivorum]|uniref:MauE/DoxX family redox-associated membrane protein n=1 Tax=Sphingobacterium multivorum TaxID=28454 RepID=UPI0028AE5673|nr:MauE/DoxX family redox-associated membrane protein [Sphingobacterium multivorum]
MKTKRATYILITLILMALWIPISLDKFMNYELFKSAMIQQPFSDQLGEFLAYSLPALELAVGLLFILPKTRLWAFRLSSLLMAAFVAYVGLAVLKVWGKFPCGCGLVFHQLGWMAHLWLNIGFLLISLLGLALELYFHKNQTPKNKIVKNSTNTAVSAGQSAATTEVPVELKTIPRLQKE